jgi:hypothetical protein
MKKFLSVCVVAGALSACAVPAFAQTTVTLTATLSGGEETPAPGVLTGAAGSARVFVDTVNEELTVTLTVVNLPAATTAGHIHIAPAGIAGPVVLDFPIPTGRTGDLSLSFRVGASSFRPQPQIGIATIADAIQSIVNGNSYVNIHTSANPAGEIRGQLSVLR